MQSESCPPPRVPGQPHDPAADGQDGWTTETLFRGRREVEIRHGAERYRLRITASNKLILTK